MLSQSIFNKMLSLEDKGIMSKILLEFFNRTRKIILKFNDPLVNYRIGEYSLSIPLSHNLPLILKKYPNYSSNIGRIAQLISEKYHTFSIIDIGANIGDSIAIIKTKIDCPILCIEGNERFFKICEHNSTFFSNINLEKVYVSIKTEHLKMKIQEDGGTAHLRDDSADNIHTETLSDILKKNPLFLQSKFIKIDTDGFDCLILRGSLNILKVAKPIVFFEYDPFFLSKQNDDGISIFAALSSIGYKKALIYDNFGDYILSIELINSYQVEDLHNYISGRGGSRYYDICVFHSEDDDLFEKIRTSEIQFFKNTVEMFA